MAEDWHENIVNLFQERPHFTVELLKAADEGCYGDIAVTSAERSTNAVGSKATTERRADAVTALTLDFGEVKKLVVITEIQSQWSDDKQRRLLGYVARSFEDHECEVELLMICRTDSLARKFREGIRVNRRWLLAPLTIGPADMPPYTDPDHPEATVEGAVLRLMLNRNLEDPEPAIRTVDRFLGSMESGTATDYADMLLNCLDDKAREILEELMKTESRPYHSEWSDKLRREGAEEGREEGRVEMSRRHLIKLCTGRSIALSDVERDRIEQCGDVDQLDRWFDRALTAGSADEVFGA
ncbi:hypothetical protein L0U85_06025 [Glycomyces sp. L485]|uniref:hypothetical protein n=1 Tax=Glycomyces sp. L485 TaxID=2909235 RepID=UPI001F4B9EF2|nr:hypothetical protein [Glycomyces sp. L485]MCH7230414.1 hypothetical protein [Glycomyces sp. L485]